MHDLGASPASPGLLFCALLLVWVAMNTFKYLGSLLKYVSNVWIKDRDESRPLTTLRKFMLFPSITSLLLDII